MNRILEVKEVLDLTDLEAEVLAVLVDTKVKLSVKKLNKILTTRGKNLYRSLERLVGLGLIEESLTRPKTYSAKRFETKLKYMVEKKSLEMQTLLSDRNDSNTEEMIFFGNRNEYRSFGETKLAKVSEKLNLIVSGAVQNNDFFAKHVSLIKRGVDIRCIIPIVDKDKEDMLKNWVRNGFKIRYNPVVQGINMIFYDDRVVQLALKEGNTSRKKSGIAINNKNLAVFWRRYFDILWKSSKRV